MRRVVEYNTGAMLFRAIVVGTFCVLLGGCLAGNRGSPSRTQPLDPDLQSINLALSDAQAQYYYSVDGPAREVYRNELVAARMYAIDRQYTEFEGSLMRERQGIGFLSTTTILGLTGAVPLVDSTGTKNILGAAAAFVTGTRSAYYDEVLLKSTIQMIINQMRGNRDTVKTKILLKRGQSTSQYPLGDALSDIEEYYRAGTLTSGIVEATEVVGEKAQAAEERKNSVEVVEVATDDSALILDTYLMPGGEIDEAHAEALRSLMVRKGRNPNDLWKIATIAAMQAERDQLVREAREAGLIP